jgi:hypothetical protein
MEKTILFAGGTNYGFERDIKVSSILIDKAGNDNISIKLELKLLGDLENIVVNSDEIGENGNYKSIDDMKNFVFLTNKGDKNESIKIKILEGDFSITHNSDNKTEFIIRGFLGGGGKTEHGGDKTEHGGDTKTEHSGDVEQ